MTDAGQSLAGVKVRLEGSKATTTTTDGSGYYAFSDLQSGGSYTITPVRTKMNFTPQNRFFNNLTQDGSADFNGIGESDPPPPPPSVVYKISGRVTTAGQPVAGVRLKLEGSKLTSTTTDGNGYYAFNDLRAGGNYAVTPVQGKMNLTPQNRSFNNLTHDESADFNGLREREPDPDPDTKSISKCTEDDENRERRKIRASYEAGWLDGIRGERPKVIAGIVRDGEVAEAALRTSDPQISFFEECRVAHVAVRYEWQVNTFFNGRPARVLNLPKQRRYICGKVLGGWFCKQI